MGTQGSPVKSYDYLLKFLLVGDSDVGKGEILDSLQDGSAESPYAYSSGELLANSSHTYSQSTGVTDPSARVLKYITDHGHLDETDLYRIISKHTLLNTLI